MFTLELEDLMFELKDGAIKHVGASNKSATAKLYDVDDVETRSFGDDRVKLSFADDEGNEVEVALFAEEARSIREQVETLEDEESVFD